MRDSFFEKYKTSEVTNTRRVINTPSAFTREHFFYIQEAGYLKSLKPHMSRRSGLQSYLFLIVLSGSGEGRIPRHRQASSCHRQRSGQTERHLRRRRWRKRQPCHCARQGRGLLFSGLPERIYPHQQ